MKQDEKFEDGWDEGSLRRGLNLKQNIAIGVAGLVGVAGLWALFSGTDTASDARLLYIKQDYEGSLKMTQGIIDDFELMDEHEEALRIQTEIYLDKNSGYYSKQEGFDALSQLFSESNSIATARAAITIGEELGHSQKRLLKFTKYLAKKNDIDSIERISEYYFHSKVDRERLKALPFLQQLPETSEKYLKMAKLELMIGASSSNIADIEKYLNSAVAMGSSEAMIELAYLQLEKAKIDPYTSADKKRHFPSMVKRAIDMGYRGDKLKHAATIIKFGRGGVPQDQTLATTLMRLAEEKEES